MRVVLTPPIARHLLVSMRALPFTFLGILALAQPGCAGKSSTSPLPVSAATKSADAGVSTARKSGVMVAPENRRPGQVKLVSASGRFVVLVFPIGQLPLVDERLNVYHLGIKTGEVRITGPQRDDTIAADIIQGNALPGDEVRSN